MHEISFVLHANDQSQRFYSRDLIRQRGRLVVNFRLVMWQHRRYDVIKESRASEFSALQRLTPGDASQKQFFKELFLL